jgi:ferredoxin--NADP+ reductase
VIPSSVASTTSYNNRVFLVEVVGLRQSQATDSLNYAIRQSGSVWLQVPYPRLNQEMRRIHRLGGRIVSMRPQDGPLPAPPVVCPHPHPPPLAPQKGNKMRKNGRYPAQNTKKKKCG